MRQPAQSLDREATSQVLDELVDQMTEKLQAGEPFDLDEYVRRYPELEDQLRKLLPGIQMLADLGHSPAETPSSEGPDTSVSHKPARGVLGDYEIVREVGRGGMGVVYEAEQVSLGRKVALKVLPFAAMLDQKQLQRFQNEARAAASLRHPNIVQVHFVGCERAVHFYAMDYIEGQTLAELIHHLRRLEGLEGEVPGDAGKAVSNLADSLASGRFAPPKASSAPDAPTAAYTHEHTPGATAETARGPQAAISTERSTKSPAYFRSIAEIGVQVAEALDHAHQNGVIHRDVKPSNVILDNEGKPWVTDFGLARIETDATLTVSGDLLGTVRYMSPEQALAKRIVVDHRTDVYSLGVTLYELLTLQPVFSGQDRQELLRQIAFEEPKAPRRLNKAVPEELEIIVLKAMAKNPAERYDTAQDLADDLKRFLEDRPIRARRPTLVERAAKWSRRHKPIVWSAAVSVFALLVVGLVGLGIGNMIITRERDAKDEALVAKDGALADRTAALKEKNEALLSAEANLLKAEAERRRAESNLTLALDALDTVYLRAIGRDRLLGDRDREEAQRELSNTEKTLIEAGLDFYAQIASQNEESTAATFETARAFLQIAMLQANLDDSEAAETAFLEAIARFKKLTQSFPNEAEYFRQLGKAYYVYGNHSRWWPQASDTFADAERALTRAIELDPKDADTYQQRGEVYPRMGEYDRALTDFEKAVQLDPKNPSRHYRLAYFLYVGAHDPQVRNYDQALQHAREAVRLAPQSAIYRASLGYAQWRVDRDHETALAHFTRALELDPSCLGAHWQRSIVYFHMGKYKESLQSADRIIQLGGNAFGARARAYQALDQFDKALADYKVAQDKEPNNLYVYEDRSSLYLARKQYEAALADLNKTLELAPRRSWAYKRRALAHFHLGHFEEAVSDIAKAMELNPKDTSALVWIPPSLVAACPDQSFREGLLELAARAVDNSPDPAGALQSRAALYLGLREWEKGQADLEKAVESETANQYAHYQYALLFLILNEAPKYRDACAAMVGRFGETDDPMAANFVAWTCTLAPDAVDDYAPVLASAAKAVEAQPHSDQFLNTLGAILYRAGRHDEAIERLTELDRRRETADGTVQSSPAYTWYFLAMSHQKAGNEEQARQYLNKANACTDEALADEENPPASNRRATLELLRKEAEALLGTDDQESAASDQKPEGEEK